MQTYPTSRGRERCMSPGDPSAYVAGQFGPQLSVAAQGEPDAMTVLSSGF